MVASRGLFCYAIVMQARTLDPVTRVPAWSYHQIRRRLKAGATVALLCATVLVSSGCQAVWDSDGRRHAAGILDLAWPDATAPESALVDGVDTSGLVSYATGNGVGIALGRVSQRGVVLPTGRAVASTLLMTGRPSSPPGPPNAAEGPFLGSTWDHDNQHSAFGVGYLSWPLPETRQTHVVLASDVLGVAMSGLRGEVSVVLGSNRQRLVQLDGDTFAIMDCIQCDLARARPSAGMVSKMGGD